MTFLYYLDMHTYRAEVLFFIGKVLINFAKKII